MLMLMLIHVCSDHFIRRMLARKLGELVYLKWALLHTSPKKTFLLPAVHVNFTASERRHDNVTET